MKKLTDRLIGKSSGIRWVISAVIAGPQLAIRYAVMGAAISTLTVLWMAHAPHAISLVWSSAMSASSVPNKKRTPQKHRPWRRFDDLSDVRVRISELTQSPEQ